MPSTAKKFLVYLFITLLFLVVYVKSLISEYNFKTVELTKDNYTGKMITLDLKQKISANITIPLDFNQETHTHSFFNEKITDGRLTVPEGNFVYYIAKATASSYWNIGYNEPKTLNASTTKLIDTPINCKPEFTRQGDDLTFSVIITDHSGHNLSYNSNKELKVVIEELPSGKVLYEIPIEFG